MRLSLVVLLALLSACGDGPKESPSPSPALTSTSTPAPMPTSTPTPIFETSDCRFEPPPRRTVECGFVTVPEDRGQAGGTTVRLHVAVFRSQSEDAAPDPVVYLEGGPGVTALELAGLSFEPYYSPFLDDRDFIMFDQRGVGLSEPALDCPEIVEFAYESLDEYLSVEEATSRFMDAVGRCRDRLTADGVNLKAYTSAESAADLNDIRLALGYDEWNLYGTSYGTRLALTVMRDHPDGVRSVVLDSVYPPEVNLFESILPNADRAFSVLFGLCEASPTCEERYPDLETTLYALVENLDREPRLISIVHPITGERHDALMTGHRILEAMFQSMYSTGLIPLLPEAVYDAADGRLGTLASAHGLILLINELNSVGMHLSVQCGEEVPFTSEVEIALVIGAHPRLSELLERDSTLEACKVWDHRVAAPVEDRPVISEIRTLVLSGELDPITPPAWGRTAAESLADSYFFEFPGVAHGVGTSGPCPLGIALAFLRDPSSEPSHECIDEMSGPQFR